MSQQALNILLVEDSAPDALLIQACLGEGSGPSHTVTHVSRATEAVQHLRGREAHVILLDLLLPDVVGVECVTLIRATAPDPAIVVISGLDNDDVIARALEEGAQHYLLKDDISAESLQRVIGLALERRHGTAVAEQ